MAVFTNNGLRAFTECVLQNEPLGDMTVKLFSNGVSPGYDTVTADFVDVSSSYYTPITLEPTDWVISVTAGVATAIYPTLSFPFSPNPGLTTVYGYRVEHSTDSKTLWADQISIPYTIPAGGGNITLDVTYRGRNL